MNGRLIKEDHIQPTTGVTTRSMGDGSIHHNELIQNTTSPHYFILENQVSGVKEPIYDAVYQNVDNTA